MVCWLCLAAPWQCQHGWVQAGLSKHCLDVALSTTLSFSSALCPCSSAHLPGSSQRSLAEQHGSASSISAIHSGFDSAPASLSTSGRDGTDTLPDALWSGSSKQDHWGLAVSHWDLSCCNQAGEPCTECWNHWVQRYFCTDVNSKCISHLHTFIIGGSVFGMGLTSILAALLVNHSSALTEPSWERVSIFHYMYDKIRCCHYTLLGCLAMWCLF